MRTGTSAQHPQTSLSEEFEVRILRSLRRIIRAVDIHSRKLASTYRVTTPQLLTLLYVAECGPVSSTQIGERVNLSNSTIVGILDRLEEKGLVRRERGTEDRRLVFVTATPAGLEMAKSAPSPLQDELLTRLHELPVGERERLAESLEKLVALMQARGIDAAPILEIGDIKKSAESLQ